MAAEHLLELGLRKFAFWGDPDRRYSQERECAFAATLKERGGLEHTSMGFPISKLPWSRKWQKVRKEMRAQLKTLEKGCGIFAKDDIAAAAISDACFSLRIKRSR